MTGSAPIPRAPRTPLLIGNWKMNKSRAGARQDFVAIQEASRAYADKLQLGLAPVTLHIPELTGSGAASGPVQLYAQNAHWALEGAHTGEVSCAMLREFGTVGSLIAHSERRQTQGETNAAAGLKIRALANAGMSVVYCVGESLEEREGGQLESVLRSQICEALETAGRQSLGELLRRPGQSAFSIAYEPVWAIGTGKAATEKEAQEAHAFIRETLQKATCPDFAQSTRILYGGSVKPANIEALMKQPDIDGALVGGASLKPASFLELCQGAVKVL